MRSTRPAIRTSTLSLGTSPPRRRQPLCSPPERDPHKIHKIKASEWGERRGDYLRRYREERDPAAWADAMARIENAWKDGANMVPVLMDALKNKVTMGECHDAMRSAQGFSFRKGGR